MMLVVYDIYKPVMNGKVAEPDGERGEGIVRYPCSPLIARVDISRHSRPTRFKF